MRNVYSHNLAEHHRFLRRVQLLSWLIRATAVVTCIIMFLWIFR
jgi:hypothetical protein